MVFSFICAAINGRMNELCNAISEIEKSAGDMKTVPAAFEREMQVVEDEITFYAVSVSVVHLCKCILSGVDTTLTVSTMLNGEYGISDVCLSLLNVVGNNGAHSKVLLPLTDEEIVKLRASADTLKEVIRSVDI